MLVTLIPASAMADEAETGINEIMAAKIMAEEETAEGMLAIETSEEENTEYVSDDTAEHVSNDTAGYVPDETTEYKSDETQAAEPAAPASEEISAAESAAPASEATQAVELNGNDPEIIREVEQDETAAAADPVQANEPEETYNAEECEENCIDAETELSCEENCIDAETEPSYENETGEYQENKFDDAADQQTELKDQLEENSENEQEEGIVYDADIMENGYPYSVAAGLFYADKWNFYQCECTSYCAYRLNETNGVAFHNYYGGVHWGDASNWGSAARSIGITVDGNPSAGSIAWWSSGHVAWVSAVNGSSVTIEEYNFGYVVIDGKYYGNHKYNTRTINSSNPSGYIHIKDLPSNGTLDLNNILDGTEYWGSQSFGTADVYINGTLVADDVSDYCSELAVGSSYEIKDIKAKNGYVYKGLASGSSYSGTISSGTTYVFLEYQSGQNLGSDFYAYIINAASDRWVHIKNNSMNAELAGTNSAVPEQIWHFVKNSDNSYTIQNEYDGSYLYVNGSSSSSGTNIATNSTVRASAQSFYIVTNGSYYRIVPAYLNGSVKCLDVAGTATSGGSNVQLYDWNSSAAQTFAIYNITKDGWTYSKPSYPDAANISSVKKSGDNFVISWNQAAVKNSKLDNRTYTLKIWKGSSTSSSAYITKKNLTSTSYTCALEDGTYTFQVWAYNTKYKNYYSTGKVYSCEISNCSHKISLVKAKAATYTSKGNKAYYKCSSCGKCFSDAKGANEITASSVTIDYKAPAKPALASVTATSSGITLTWSKASGATAYYVYRKAAGGSWTKLTGSYTTKLTYTDKTASKNTLYYYSVAAYNKTSGKTGSYDTSGKAAIIWTKPAFTVKGSGTGITVSWSKISCASAYIIYRKTAGGSWSKLKTVKNATSYTDTSAAAGTVYYYALRAYNSTTKSYSSYKSLSSIKLAKTKSVTATASTSYITVKWSSVANAQGYYVYRKMKGDSCYSLIKTISSASTLKYKDKDLIKGQYYYYAIVPYTKVTGSISTGSAKACSAVKALSGKTLVTSGWVEASSVPAGAKITATKTQYSYRDKTTMSSSSSSVSGWTLYNTSKSFSSWSAWQDTPVSAASDRNVQTQSVIDSYTMQTSCYGNSAGYRCWLPYDQSGYTLRLRYPDVTWSVADMNSASVYSQGTYYTYATSVNGYIIGPGCAYVKAGDWCPYYIKSTNYKTQYRYQTAVYTYYFYKWSDYSAWSDTAVTASANREVKTREMVKYQYYK